MISVYINNCSRNIPGNVGLFIIEVDNIVSVTITADEVSEIVLTAGTSFKHVDVDLDTLKRDEIQQTKWPESWTHNLNFKLSKPSLSISDLTNQLRTASPCGMAAIVIDSNGQGWLIGWNYIENYIRALYLKDYNLDSGSADEVAGVDFGLTTLSEFKDLPFDNALNSYLAANIDQDELLFVNPASSTTVDSTIITVDSTVITADEI